MIGGSGARRLRPRRTSCRAARPPQDPCTPFRFPRALPHDPIPLHLCTAGQQCSRERRTRRHPRRPAPDVAAPDGLCPDPHVTVPAGSAPMARILVVDDDPDITFAVSLYLKREQHEVRTAASRAEGMEAVKAFSPELIILDVMMEQPDDGIAMAQDLRRAGSTVPIIMLTSVGQVTGMKLRPRQRPGARGRVLREAGAPRRPAEGRRRPAEKVGRGPC